MKFTYKYAMPEHKFIEKVKTLPKCKMCLKYFHIRKRQKPQISLSLLNETFYYVFLWDRDLRVIDSLIKPHHPVRCPFIENNELVMIYNYQTSSLEVWRQSGNLPSVSQLSPQKNCSVPLHPDSSSKPLFLQPLKLSSYVSHRFSGSLTCVKGMS